MKIKVFSAYADAIERDVNRWLDEHPSITVSHMNQSAVQGTNGAFATITILYKDAPEPIHGAVELVKMERSSRISGL